MGAAALVPGTDAELSAARTIHFTLAERLTTGGDAEPGPGADELEPRSVDHPAAGANPDCDGRPGTVTGRLA
jgi:hypothetical protein